ncbi:ankyrin repeat domain-containing protein [Candidatus Protochlamydia sp. R18]|uniref:ankyrin repeat domain-containing protein n=1 Tax=Candidatus Protochlamydia sp. R18 TaxID=1353977 RepID=UPI0005A9F644|nr:ankyrin repeat domain-containing protein [Candidatus Protochlamydia sp. R18]
MIRDEPIDFQAQNIIAAASEISENLCIVSLPNETIYNIFTFLTENSKNLLNLRLVCSWFKAIIETDGNCKRFFKMSTSRDPLFQNSSKFSNYLSKFLSHLYPGLTSKPGIDKLIMRPSFKDHFAITILNLFLQNVLRASSISTGKKALIEKINDLKTHLYISIDSHPYSTSFELQEKQNQEIINPLLKLFIKLEVDPTAVNRQTRLSLLGEAAALQNAEGIRIILKALKNKGITGEKLIKKLNTQYSYGQTALHYLANSVNMPYFNRNKTEETLKLLLDHGADLHVENQRGYTPLRNFQNSAELKKILKNIYPNYETKKNQKSSSPIEKLYTAIKQGDLDKVKELLENDKNFIKHRVTYQWMTPLMHALRRGNLQIVKILLSYDPDITLLDDIGCSVFHYCVGSGELKVKAKVDILKELIRRAKSSGQTGMISKADAWGNFTPLSTAIEKNSDPLELVQLLLPYYRDKINQKPYLSMAVFNDQFEVVRLLLEEGAEINSQQLYRGHSPFYWAAFHGNVEMTRLLLKFNKDPHEVNANHEDGMTILHVATTNMHLEMMEFLLSQEKIDLYVQDDEGHTPLYIAVESGYYEGAKLLIHSGAQIKLTENSKILSEEGPHFDKLRHHLLYLFIKNKDLDSLQLILNSPFDLQLTTAHEEFGKSPIMYAKEIDPNIMQMIYRLTLNKSNRNGNYSN